MFLEEPEGVARLDVMGKEEHAYLWMLVPNLLRGDEPLVCVRRRHADVDDRDVWSFEPDLPQQGRGILGLGDHVNVRAFEQSYDPLPSQHRVLGDDYAHGISARVVPSSRRT